MGDVRIVWTPRGETQAVEANLSDAYGARGLQLLKAKPRQTTRTNISAGGVAVSHTEDHYFEYDIKLDGVHQVEQLELFRELMGFISHAQAGGVFAFKVDTAMDGETTLNGAVTEGDATIVVAAGIGFGAGDLIYIEDGADSSRWQVSTLGSRNGASFESMAPVMYHSYADGSPVRHWEYFPKCIAILGSPTFVERPAGRGPWLWDFRLRMRTVRNA